MILSRFSHCKMRCLMMLGVVMFIFLPLLTGQSWENYTCSEERKDINVRVEAEGCSSKSILTGQQVCTLNPGPLASSNVNPANESCPSISFTKVNATLSCFNGYQQHSTLVPSVKLTLNETNCTENTVFSAPQQAETWPLELYKIVQPIIILVGLVGNVLSFLVMTSKYMRQFSFSVYLQTLAVIDTLVLLHYGMDYIDVLAYRNPVFEQRMKRYTPCLFYPYFVRVAQLSSAWCVVAFTVDRSVAICSPFFARHYSTILHARIINAIVILVVMLSQVYHPILLDQDTLYCHNPFSIPTTADRFGSMELMVVISRAALLMLVPFVIVLICNLRVIVAVKRRSTIAEITSTSSSDSSNNSSIGRNLEAENKMSLKLFSVSLTFLVLSLPDCIVVFLDIRNMLAGVQRWYLLNNNFRFIASMVFSLNFAINYLLYGFAFRKKAMLFSSLPNCLRRRDR